MKTDLPTQETLRKLLDFNPETGALTWRPRTPDMFEDGKRTADHRCKAYNARFAGNPAFTSDNGEGYLCGTIFNRNFRASRVIWAMETGAWPDGQIDHINGVRDDNRIENLRDVSNMENLRNQARRKTNTSGAMGVYFNKNSGKWQARIRDNGKQLSLGYFTSKSDAIDARRQAEIEHGYHENHGRVLTQE